MATLWVVQVVPPSAVDPTKGNARAKQVLAVGRLIAPNPPKAPEFLGVQVIPPSVVATTMRLPTTKQVLALRQLTS
jgi:hypothetical protein